MALNSGEHSFGLSIIGGKFGAGKTRNVFKDCFKWKKKYPYGILIANIPYDFVDIHFDSSQDLFQILQWLVQYMEETNKIETLKQGTWIPIRIVVDEAHLYFFSREFKKFNYDSLLSFTQCRKRNIQIFFVTQELAQIDALIRRLVPFVYRYQTYFFGWLTREILYYFRTYETTDVGDSSQVEVVQVKTVDINLKRFNKTFRKKYQQFWYQKFLTYYIVGSANVLAIDKQSFFDLLSVEKYEILSQIETGLGDIQNGGEIDSQI